MENKDYDIQTLIDSCIQELKAIEIPVTEKCCYKKLDKRSKNTVGKCTHYLQKDEYILSFHAEIFKKGSNIKLIKGVICHELLHTVKGLKTHEIKFQDYAKKIEDAYGYEPLRLPKINEFYEDKQLIGKLICPKCGIYKYIYHGQEKDYSYCSEHRLYRRKILF